MNTTRISILTSNNKFIGKLKDDNVPMIQENDFMYTVIVPVYVEAQLCNFISESAAETKADVAVHVFYQDPCGESSEGIMYFVKGKTVS